MQGYLATFAVPLQLVAGTLEAVVQVGARIGERARARAALASLKSHVVVVVVAGTSPADVCLSRGCGQLLKVSGPTEGAADRIGHWSRDALQRCEAALASRVVQEDGACRGLYLKLPGGAR